MGHLGFRLFDDRIIPDPDGGMYLFAELRDLFEDLPLTLFQNKRLSLRTIPGIEARRSAGSWADSATYSSVTVSW
jgi:hypothetical protein